MRSLFRGIKRFFAWIYDWFTRPAARIGLGILVTGGFIAGVGFWALFNTGMNYTNTEEFCVSCHTMRDNLLPELQKTIHWKNRTGVRARCMDCHVPHNFTDKVARKMQASREVLSHVVGTIGTREKFLQHRIVLAQREWARFKANNSKECRSCHDYKSMDFDKMRVTSQMMMRSAAERNASCVDCHRGIAHQLPEIKGAGNPAFASLLSEASHVSVKPGNDYVSVSPQAIYADKELSKKIGSIEVTTPVKLLEATDSAYHVELELWRKNKGLARVWYNTFGMNVTNAILNRDIDKNADFIDVVESKEDDMTGLEWQKVKATVWIEPGHLLNSVEPIWDIARHSYESSCSVCHRQPQTTSHTANQWPGLFAGMVGFTNMDDETAKVVLKYLQLNSSDFSNNSATEIEKSVQTARP
ncbi:pentaheme c-type cytochrome TorC [Brackiella oedipodis]|uniref:pentaheme c-type cytochrome TorC n=1 Tax=Brackiella oedipodis TaxID=124225 RepID=UPI00049173DF|nr:pentaheme c-type cytochrome TorC [Brackiella oedipodis]